jgi:hypothetical protein
LKTGIVSRAEITKLIIGNEISTMSTIHRSA